ARLEAAIGLRPPADEVDHAADAGAVTPVRVVQVRPAGRAVADVVDARGAQAGRHELLEAGRAQVEVGPAPRAGAEERGPRGPEGLTQLLPDLVAAGTDARPERGPQVLRVGAPGHERLHRPGRDPARRPPPARVDRGHREAP